MTATAPVVQLSSARKVPAWWPNYKEQIQLRMVRDRELPPLARNVGAILLNHLNYQAGTAWPRIRFIAEQLGFDTTAANYKNNAKRQITRALGQLVARGHWTAERRHRHDGSSTSTRYAPTLPTPDRADSAVTQGGQQRHPGVTPASPHEPAKPNPRREPNHTPQTPRAATGTPEGEGTEKDPERAGPEATPPAQASQDHAPTPGDTAHTLTARFLRRRFKIDRRDAPDMLAAWRREFGDDRTANILRDTAAFTDSREAIVAAFAAEKAHQARGAADPARQDDAAPSDPTWAHVREKLRQTVGETAFRSWLQPLAYAGRAGQAVQLEARTDFARGWIVRHYADQLRALWQAADPTVSEVQITTAAG